MLPRRFLPVLCALLVSIIVSASAASAPEQYDLWVLQPFGGSGTYESYAWDANNQAAVCGTATSGGGYVGYLRLNAADTRALVVPWLRGINEAGRVVGHNLLIDPATETQTIIPRLSAYYYLVWANDVNDNDVVVGYAAWHNNEEGLNQAGFVWDAVNGTRGTTVPGLTGLLAINNENVAVGNIQRSVGSSEAVVYKVNTGEAINLDDILTPDLGSPGYSEVRHINNLGVVAGEGWNGSVYAAFTWSDTDGFAFLPGLSGGDRDRVHPTGITDDGNVVGYALTPNLGWRAFSWDASGGMRDLNNYVTGGGNFVCSRALRVSANGVIVGDGYFATDGRNFGAPRAFLLVPREFTASGIKDTPAAAGIEVGAYPNPFNPQTTITYDLSQPGPVRVDVFRVSGEFVTTLVNGVAAAGTNRTSWNGRDARGRAVSSGTYLVRVATPSTSVTTKVVLLK